MVEYLHDRQHAKEDAIAAESARAAGLPEKSHEPHDETNCAFHAQLHVPLISAGWVPLLVFLGLFVAFLSTLAPALATQRLPSCMVCRGPPAR